MEGNKSKPRALLVFGAPCSGKTTFSEKFAEKFDLALYDFDMLKDQYRLTRKNTLLIIKLIARTGKTIIIEGGLSTERERAEIRNLLRSVGYEPSLVWIQTDVTTIRNRLKARYKSVSKAKEIFDNELSAMEAPSEAEEPIILSGKHTFETQTKHVLAGLAENGKA